MKLKPDEFTLYIITVSSVLIFIAISLIARVTTTQQALKLQCGVSYNLLQVAAAGDNLTRICQYKNQTVIVK